MTKQVQSYVKKRLDFSDLTSSRRLLCLLDEQGALTQPEAAALLAMSTGACNLHFQRLEHVGLISRIDKRSQGRGRPTLVWDIDHPRNACITLVFDVPFFQATLCDFSGNIVQSTREDLTDVTDQDALVLRIHAFVQQAVDAMKRTDGHIRQIYCALPGLLNRHSGEVLAAANSPVLKGLNLKQILEPRFHIPCHVGSLGPAFYNGEISSTSQDHVTLLIHWDLGVGFVFGQGHRILTLHATANGENPLISELGHIRVARDGNPCHCGKSGCLEAYVGGSAILNSLADPRIQTLPQLVHAVQSGDPAALHETQKAAHLLGSHLSWPLQLMNVRQVVISGPFAPALTQAIPDLQRGLANTFSPQEIEQLGLHVSAEPETRVQYGAFTLAKRLFLYPEEYQTHPYQPKR